MKELTISISDYTGSMMLLVNLEICFQNLYQIEIR